MIFTLLYADFWECWNTGFICKTDVMKIYHQYIGVADRNVNTEGCVNNLYLWWKIQVVRRFLLFLPTSYNESNSNPVPLLVDFHGCSLQSTATIICIACFFITLATNHLAVGKVNPIIANYHQLSCSWGGSPNDQASNFRQLAKEEGFLLVSATNLNQTVQCIVKLWSWHRWLAKAWVTLTELLMHLAGGVGMCRRFLSTLY